MENEASRELGEKLCPGDEEKIEHIADLIGPWGPFQRKLFIILAIVYSVSPFSNLSLSFYMTKSDFYCVSQNSVPVNVNSNARRIDMIPDVSSDSGGRKRRPLRCWVVRQVVSQYNSNNVD